MSVRASESGLFWILAVGGRDLETSCLKMYGCRAFRFVGFDPSSTFVGRSRKLSRSHSALSASTCLVGISMASAIRSSRNTASSPLNPERRQSPVKLGRRARMAARPALGEGGGFTARDL